MLIQSVNGFCKATHKNNGGEYTAKSLYLPVAGVHREKGREVDHL